jgi:hypothetical protein
VKSFSKAIIVALLQVAIVFSLGGKLLYDRAHRPRVWVRTGMIDPELPIRGRYLTLNVEVYAPGAAPSQNGRFKTYGNTPVELEVEDGRIVAHPTDKQTGLTVMSPHRLPLEARSDVRLLWPGVLFFLPEHAEIPRVKSGEELWAEVTIPKKGPPRPIQLALKRGDQWTPLNYR